MVEVQKTLDSWFGKIQKAASDTIPHFVAFLFFILAIGAFIGIIVAQNYPNQAMLAVLLPALAGALAYYNRAFATAVFLIMMIIIFIL
ncbi:MAG: hypothetical protein PHY04_00395 [Candidatus ainarchaeum sp.]|jgi:hypothetical protein|nr:hypothetical protein [Candidatus ainarchaeum sp.]MDD3085475.1 hypothetical protein [Candidatus ainarchaeum sp.]MDD4128182.1 hypothetical protein [Candidatus ainarchaeum sp.]HPM86032.1 hypothetical protein [archaeon]